MRLMTILGRSPRCWPAALVLALAFGSSPGLAQQPVPPVEFPPPVDVAPPAGIAPPQRLPAPDDSSAVPRAMQPLVQNIENIPAPAGPVQLIDFEQTALANHPQLAAAWQAVEAAEGRAWQARRYPNPQFGVASPQLAGSESQYNTFVSQDILTGRKLVLDQSAACYEVERARLAMVRARFEVLTGVRRNFYETLAAQQRVAVLADLARLAARSRQIGEALLKGGEGTRTDTLLLEIELQRAEAAHQSALAVLEAARRQLAAASGVPTMPVGPLQGDLAAPSMQVELERVGPEAALVNAQTGMASVGVDRARVLLQRAIVEPYPTFNVMAGYQRQLSGVEDQGIAQVTMSVPLWDRNQGGIREAEANIGRAEAEVRRVQLELSTQAAEAVGRYQSAVVQVARYEREILPRSRESVTLTQRLYEQGELDFLRLLSAQKTLGEVNLGYVEAQAARWTAAADLANLLQREEFP
jgi:cobalt-zinc-cadmium efflux system outer membrane protein